MYIASLDLFERQGMTPEMGRIGNRMGALKAAFYHSSRGGRIKLSDFVTGRTMEEIIEVQRALEMEDLESIPANSWFSSQVTTTPKTKIYLVSVEGILEFKSTKIII